VTAGRRPAVAARSVPPEDFTEAARPGPMRRYTRKNRIPPIDAKARLRSQKLPASVPARKRWTVAVRYRT
jgi:hypothetical protein